MKNSYSTDYSEALDQIPPGIYSAKPISESPYTSKSNTACIKIMIRVTEGKFNGRTVPLILPLGGKASGFLRQFLKVFNPNYTEGSFSGEDFLEKPMKIKIDKSTYAGGVRSYLKITPYPASYMEVSEMPTDNKGGAQ